MKSTIGTSILKRALGIAVIAAVVMTAAPTAFATTNANAEYAGFPTSTDGYHAAVKVRHGKFIGSKGFGRSHGGFRHREFRRHHFPKHHYFKSFGHGKHYKGHHSNKHHKRGHGNFKKGFGFKKFFKFKG